MLTYTKKELPPALSDGHEDDALAITAVAVGLGLEIGGIVLSIRSSNRLSSALWWYNQTLDRP